LPRTEDIFEYYSVLYDLKRKRFLVQGEYRLPWIDGDAPTISKEFAYSYDGKHYVFWEKRKNDNNDSSVKSASASISDEFSHSDDIQGFVKSNAARVGYGTGFPASVTLRTTNYFGAVSIFDLLKDWNSKKLPVLLNETQDGNWDIEGTIDWSDDPDDRVRHIRISCDPTNDGIVDEYTLIYRSDKDYTEEKVLVEFTTNSQGKLVPKTSWLIYPLDRKMTEFHYDNVEFNPNVTDDSFHFDIPDGTYVTDYITKTYYKVGDLFNEDKAIEDFMVREGLTGNLPTRFAIDNFRRYLLMGIGLLIIVFGTFFYVIKKKGQAT